VLFCEAAEVDMEHLQALHNAETAASDSQPNASHPALGDAVGEDAADRSDPMRMLRRALAHEIVTEIASGRPSLAPVGKWLAEDLVLTADRLSGGVSRRAADLLGIPDTTYRRQLQAAVARRMSGLAVRSPKWGAVTSLLEALIRARPDGADVREWAEAGLLAEIHIAAPDDTRTAGALLGVTEPTLLRRKAALARRS
jgi:hypothetical protein